MNLTDTCACGATTTAHDRGYANGAADLVHGDGAEANLAADRFAHEESLLGHPPIGELAYWVGYSHGWYDARQERGAK